MRFLDLGNLEDGTGREQSTAQHRTYRAVPLESNCSTQFDLSSFPLSKRLYFCTPKGGEDDQILPPPQSLDLRYACLTRCITWKERSFENPGGGKRKEEEKNKKGESTKVPSRCLWCSRRNGALHSGAPGKKSWSRGASAT
ncbi:hypothetical protein POX_d05184 [Penicillium oxalicum]|uniref:hypothetical protein n=1 Tax=Penicillium oxalicum TaxID=69781 RepID=UPI0020B697BB|nr:hypothetical protein POX_d05184 [Penicillium oxalicum]KAI2789688.1 hypothetical protein POX_d05184 [Penicillium oxalicum]